MTARSPVRLADLASDPELASAIRALRQTPANPMQVARLAEQLAPQLAQHAVGSASRTALGASGKTWIAGAVALAIALGTLLYTRPSALPSQERPPPLPVASEYVPLPVPLPLPELPPPAELPPTAPQSPAPSPRASTKPKPIAHRARRAELPAVSSIAPERELAMLERSRAVLDREPAEALARAEEHARAYPDGLFAQEREVLAIEALLKLRRRAQAVARAADFMRRFPESSHVRRVRALLDRSRVEPATTTEGSTDSRAGSSE